MKTAMSQIVASNTTVEAEAADWKEAGMVRARIGGRGKCRARRSGDRRLKRARSASATGTVGSESEEKFRARRYTRRSSWVRRECAAKRRRAPSRRKGEAVNGAHSAGNRTSTLPAATIHLRVSRPYEPRSDPNGNLCLPPSNPSQDRPP